MDFDAVDLYKTFLNEWLSKYDTYQNWEDFIESKDLGIICTKTANTSSEDDKYEIVDEKKWTLTKIKYGF